MAEWDLTRRAALEADGWRLTVPGEYEGGIRVGRGWIKFGRGGGVFVGGKPIPIRTEPPLGRDEPPAPNEGG